MQFALDHVLIGCADLATLMRWFEQETGIAPAPGGSHAGFGTRNALVSLGGDHYLELIALDPAQEISSPLATSIAKLERPAAIGWAFHCGDAARAAASLRSAGLKVRETAMQRRTPAGTLLSWRLVFVDRAPGPVIPFLIDWQKTPSPAATAPGGVRLENVAPMHPEPPEAQVILDAMQIRAEVLKGPRSGPRLEFSTPKGTLAVAP
jgi:hypothetical protein